MRILLVRLRLIGDVVFTTPLIRALRRRYPSAHLSYVVESAAAPVLLRNPHLTELITVSRQRGIQRLRDDIHLARRLRRARFDLAIDLHGGPRAAWLTWASGAPRRIGFSIAGRSWMYTDVVPRPADLSPRHSVRNQWDILSPLGIPPPDSVSDAVEMPLSPDAAARVTDRLTAHGVTSRHQLIVVHVSAGNPFRRWPATAFVDLAVRLAQQDGDRRLVLTAGPSERDAADAIATAARAGLGDRAGQIPSCGEWDLEELRALIDRAALYIGGDSGPLHVASTTATPIVALFGPTLAGRSLPWRDPRWRAEAVEPAPLPCRPCAQRRCEPGDFRCLTSLAPDQVLDAAARALTPRG